MSTKPTLWYFETENGTFLLFDRPSRHASTCCLTWDTEDMDFYSEFCNFIQLSDLT